MWFFRNRNSKADNSLQLTNRSFPREFTVAAKRDTDHSTGIGLVAITGRYDSKQDSFRVESSYALGGSTTAHGKYGVTDEKVLSLGLEQRFNAFGRSNAVDVSYLPHSDIATMKVSMRQSIAKVSGIFLFENVKTNRLALNSQRYELDARLNRMEAIKMAFNARNNSANIKFLRKLDSGKNRLDVEYHYGNPGRRFMTFCWNHFYSKRHTFALTTNYGLKKYNLEWDCKTANGPWTISTDFSFNKGTVTRTEKHMDFELKQCQTEFGDYHLH